MIYPNTGIKPIVKGTDIMKVNTVEQYKILKYIKDNFEMNYITLELIDRYTIKITDRNNDSMDFIYKDGNVVYN